MSYPFMAQELLEQREIAVATIQRQNELYESVSQQLQEAREELLKCELRQVGRRQVEAILREEIERHVQKQPCGHPYACVRQVEPWGDGFVQVCAWCESLEKAGAEVKRYREALEGVIDYDFDGRPNDPAVHAAWDAARSALKGTDNE